jgi:hypothetical protein
MFWICLGIGPFFFARGRVLRDRNERFALENPVFRIGCRGTSCDEILYRAWELRLVRILFRQIIWQIWNKHSSDRRLAAYAAADMDPAQGLAKGIVSI